MTNYFYDTTMPRPRKAEFVVGYKGARPGQAMFQLAAEYSYNLIINTIDSSLHKTNHFLIAGVGVITNRRLYIVAWTDNPELRLRGQVMDLHCK